MYERNDFNYARGEDLYSSSWFYGSREAISAKDYTSFIIKETVKDAPSKEYGVDDLDALFKDRLRFQKLSTFQTLNLLVEREAIRDQNISSIDSRAMYCFENLSRLRMWTGPAPTESRTAGGLQRLVVDLEKQKRDERVMSWKDTLELKLSLIEKIQGYQNLKRQEALLENVPGY